jgi:uncharacterized protein
MVMEINAQSKIHAYCAAHKEIMLAYLFGSRASGKAAPDSDYDIGLLTCEEMPEEWRYQVAHELLVLLDGATVDVVLLNRAPIELAYNVVGGIRLFEREVAARVEFEANVYSRYSDWLPVLRAQRAELIQRGPDEAGFQRCRAALAKTERVLAEIRAHAQQDAG